MTDNRRSFFDSVYAGAQGRADRVPWADSKPKPHIAAWIDSNPGHGRRALDIGCGLGDHAEALAKAGWKTTAFDFSADAIRWAKQRFPDSTVDYRVADLLGPPAEWRGAFDLVNECYTIQSVPPDLHEQMARAIASFVRPDGMLLVYTRVRPAVSEPQGPPWPLSPTEAGIFAGMGFVAESTIEFDVERPDKTIPHRFTCWRRLGFILFWNDCYDVAWSS